MSHKIAGELMSDNFWIRQGTSYKRPYVYRSKEPRIDRYRIGHIENGMMNLYAMSRKGEVWLSPSDMVELSRLIELWVSENEKETT